MKQSTAILRQTDRLPRRVALTINERFSQELIIALVGPVASGVSTTAGFLTEILSQKYGYSVAEVIKPSAIIKQEAYRVNRIPPSVENLGGYIDQMQDIGNLLREKFGNDYLAEKAVEHIVKFRKSQGGYQDDILLPGRRAYIIDSLKNTEELDLLRSIYGETLCLFGVFAPDALRKARLIDAGTSTLDAEKIIDRDQNEVMTFGQKTRKMFVAADFFLCNDQKTGELRARVERLLDIVFSASIRTPTRAETAMYEATSAASNSACMSRQVGAAIISGRGELISVGWNDVPKFGGSLYREDDQSVWSSDKGRIEDGDHRCFKWGTRICHNEIRRKKISEGIIDRVVNAKFVKPGTKRKEVSDSFAGTEIDDLIEFSRSIHAEMEAILAAAREGKHSLVGATLYTNTYPCHNCARHIVAAGIKSVVYIEPYRKSLATTLHADAITEDPDERSKVVFRQFDGVAPRNFLRLFKVAVDRKRDGHVVSVDCKLAVPIFRMALDSPSLYESKVIADLTAKEQTVIA